MQLQERRRTEVFGQGRLKGALGETIGVSTEIWTFGYLLEAKL